jgi:hypothetical protein
METEMRYSITQQTESIARVRILFMAALVFACAFGTVSNAAAQNLTSPPTPTNITPEEGNVAFLVGHAKGTQGYTCLPTSTGGTAWTVTPPRPEATLFTSFFGHDIQIITHFLSPDANPNDFAPKPLPAGGNATWQSSLDSSRVWAVSPMGASVVAGTDSSCPHAGSIPCLLLQSIGNQKGPTGGSLLANVSFVQRLNTNGGSAPNTSCSVGQTLLVPYTADYYFFHGRH